jgi:CheY-like chemotaxis protein
VDHPVHVNPLVAVVDNEEMLLALLHDLFEDRGWDILPLSDGATAFEQLKRRQPDVILLDLRLGGAVTGWHVLENLKLDPQTRTIPVVVWSGAAAYLRDKEEWLAERGSPILEKPFEIERLYEILDLAMQHVMKRPEPI